MENPQTPRIEEFECANPEIHFRVTFGSGTRYATDRAHAEAQAAAMSENARQWRINHPIRRRWQ